MTVQILFSRDKKFQDVKAVVDAMKDDNNNEVHDSFKAALTGFVDRGGTAILPKDGVLLMMGDSSWLQSALDQAVSDGIRAFESAERDFLGIWGCRKSFGIVFTHTVSIIGVATQEYWGGPVIKAYNPWETLAYDNKPQTVQNLKDNVVPKARKLK